MSMIIVRVMLAIRLGARPKLDPDRLAIVLSAELELKQAALSALLDVGKDGVEAFAVFGCCGDERHAERARDILGLEAQQLHAGLIDRDELRLGGFVDVGDRSFVEEGAKTLFAFLQHLLHPKATRARRRRGRRRCGR